METTLVKFQDPIKFEYVGEPDLTDGRYPVYANVVSMSGRYLNIDRIANQIVLPEPQHRPWPPGSIIRMNLEDRKIYSVMIKGDMPKGVIGFVEPIRGDRTSTIVVFRKGDRVGVLTDTQTGGIYFPETADVAHSGWKQSASDIVLELYGPEVELAIRHVFTSTSLKENGRSPFSRNVVIADDLTGVGESGIPAKDKLFQWIPVETLWGEILSGVPYPTMTQLVVSYLRFTKEAEKLA